MSATPSVSTSALPPLRILVADDDTVFATAVSGLLRRLGHWVEAVGTGREAVCAAMIREYDIMFLDMLMPELGGIEAARSIRERFPEGQSPFIIGLSAERDPEEFPPGTGMDHFLVKPVCLADLVQVLTHPDGS
jgi:CheY-like chemotaxis protein